ncbi:recombinase family protein [Streptomyces silvisoli]|uniref:Recombinase family protein n=1 Tax=Streptomyces silvisoli TaxID=3034235 RepID=A0ABT5ZLM8_9ACTN|nr:recombinase family protein [Streptomyces silvisoli]MDF3290734.1 recombinase family protein [Streptomyces silvisoli]
MADTMRKYLRVSKDKDGQERSVGEQDDDLDHDAKSNGWNLGTSYKEAGGVSASRFSRKTRDDFARLLADLEKGTFGANILGLWESSRGSRRVGEWATLLDLLEDAGVRVWVSTHRRLYDPANGRDRRTLLEDAVDSEFESSKISTRTLRTAASEAAKGRPWGPPPYGYRRVYNPNTGKLINWEPDPEEAPVIREMYKRLRQGHSLREISQDFAKRDIIGRNGAPISPQNLRSMAMRPAHAGLRVHHGETVRGTWDALVTPETFYAVQRLLTSPERKTTRNGRAVHELTMIIRCDVCGGPMAATSSGTRKKGGGYARYLCHERHCVRIEKADVDALLIGTEEQPGVLLAYLASDRVYADLARPEGADERAQALRDLIEEARANLAEVEAAKPETLAEAKMFAKSAETLAERISGLEAEARALTTPAALLDIMQPGADVWQRWQAAPISSRREVARLLLSPRYLGEVRVRRSPVKGHQVSATDRITFRREAPPRSG